MFLSLQAVTAPAEAQILLSIDNWAKRAVETADRNASWRGARMGPAVGDVDPVAGTKLPRSSFLPEDIVLTAVTSKVNLTLSGYDAAAVVAVATGISAEVSRKFRYPLPARSFSPDQNDALGKPAAVATVSAMIPSTSLVLAGREREQLQIARDSYLSIPSGGPIRVLLGAPSLELALRVGDPGKADEAAIMVELTNPLLWAVPNVGIVVPRADVRLGKPAKGHGVRTVKEKSGFQRPSSLVASLGSLFLPGRALEEGAAQHSSSLEWTPDAHQPCIVLTQLQAESKVPRKTYDNAERDASALRNDATGPPAQVFVAAVSVAADLDLKEWEHLVVLGCAFLADPSLPQLPGYPPHVLQTPSSPLHVHCSLTQLEATVVGLMRPLKLAVEDLNLATERHSYWVRTRDTTLCSRSIQIVRCPSQMYSSVTG